MSLICLEPNANRDAATYAGPATQFEAKRVAADLKPKVLVAPLLEAARRIFDLGEPPASAEGCEDCARVDDLVRGLFRPPP